MGQSKDPDIYNCGLSFFVKSVALAFIFKVHIHARSKVSALIIGIIDLVRLLCDDSLELIHIKRGPCVQYGALWPLSATNNSSVI